MKISSKICLSFLILAVVLTSVGVSITYLMYKDFLEYKINLHLRTITRSKKNHIETFIHMMKGRFIDFSSDGKIEDCLYNLNMNNSECTSESLSYHLKENKLPLIDELQKVFAIGLNGKIVASSLSEDIGLDKKDEPYFVYGKEKPFIEVHLSKTTNTIALTVSAPVIRQGEPVGVIIGKIKPDLLFDILVDRTGLGETGEIYLVNKDGYMITPSRFIKDTVLKQKVNIPNTIEAFENYRKYTTRLGEIEEHEEEYLIFENYRGMPVIGTYAYIPEMQWVLLAEINEKEAMASLDRLKTIYTVTMLFVLVVAWIIGVIISRRITKPIYELSRGTEIIGRGELDYKVGIPAKDEIGQLSRSFDKMTVRLKEKTTSLYKEITERKRTEELLDSINRIQSQFITDTEPRVLFDNLLNNILSLTQSKYGFIGEVLYTDKGEQYFKTHAITNIARNQETQALYEKYSSTGMEFCNLKTLFSAVITTEKPVISNNPSKDSRRGELSKDHPPLNNFLGLPFFHGNKLAGMVGMANRSGGYDNKLVEYLQPLLSTCGNIIVAYRTEQIHKKSKEQLRVLLSKLSVIEEQERRRISGELHDNISLNMALSNIKLAVLQKSFPDIAKDLDETRGLIKQAIEFTRSLTFELSSPVLYELGFKAAVEGLIEETQEKHGISIEFVSVSGESLRELNREISILLYKTVRELLLNIVKHARAHKARICVNSDGDNIRVRVEDDGIGFDISKTNLYSTKDKCFGIFSIRERIRYLGGTFEITSKPGQGTGVIIVVPIQRKNNKVTMK